MAPDPSLAPPQRLARALAKPPRDPAATAWLADLPRLLRRQLDHWRLTLERVVTPGGRSSLVALVRQADGEPAALKLPAPLPATAQEPAALAHWDGLGAARLLRAETATSGTALLLERLRPEVSLRSLPEPKAELEAVSTVRRLWVPPAPDHPFATVAERTRHAATWLRSVAPEEVLPLVDEALETREALLADATEELLLHGDFRQGSVLAADTGRARWLTVGPEPVVGERAYDLARLVRDRLHDLFASGGAAAVARRRVTRLADALEVDPDRLRGWARYRAVESGVRHLAAGDRTDGELLLEFAGWL
mgnify:CR=1 FL=1